MIQVWRRKFGQDSHLESKNEYHEVVRTFNVRAYDILTILYKTSSPWFDHYICLFRGSVITLIFKTNSPGLYESWRGIDFEDEDCS